MDWKDAPDVPNVRRHHVLATSLVRVAHEPSHHGEITGANLVDPDDPAFHHITRAALKLIEFGFDPSDPDIAARAIEVGRKNYDEDPATRARRYIRESLVTRFGIDGESPAAEVVYYMRIGNRVKIGWSTSLASRLASINPEELMATEPGDRELEKLRHQQFRALRTHGEWFRMEPPLLDHIRQVKGRSAA